MPRTPGKTKTLAATPRLETSAVLFDAYSVLFRAFHALPRLTTSTGVPSSALYGFSSLVLKVLREYRPRALSFAVDAPTRTFRAERYPEYKAGRARTPSELAQELERFPKLLEAFGAPVFCVPGFEADDILATLAKTLSDRGENVLVVSGDRDLLQTAAPHSRVLFLGRRGQEPELYDAAKVEARFGVPPAKLPSFAALVGDNSDNLQGVPGVGPRTAAELVSEFGSMPALVANLERVASAKVRELLRPAAERLLLNEDLARLRDDVPLPEGPAAAPLTRQGALRLRALFEELEFKSLVARLERLELSDG
ncbi:MAG TPA: 5'-3' exonuclease H3TH domain-containing protein [Polyangiaceae bacterium]